jgi:hypothetical protein
MCGYDWRDNTSSLTGAYMKIVFRNKGSIDPRSITTFGVSSKESDSAIGYFGTGLKYAIAILLREGCQVDIFTGGEHLVFGTLEQRVRVDDFTFVTMNNQPLSFTTELGKNWKVWQAIRELWCNCLDERGEAFSSDYFDDAPSSGETVILVSGRAALDAWAARDTIMISSQPLFSTELVDIHPGQSDHIYYKGVRVLDLSRPSQFTYNLKSGISLTEDRTMTHPSLAGWYAAKGIASLSDKPFLARVLTAGQEWFEHRLDFDGAVACDDFCGIVKQMARQQATGLNTTATRCARFDHNELLDDLPRMQLGKVDEIRLAKAIGFAKSIGFAVDEYEIVAIENLGECVLGRAANGKIYLSKTVFMQGTKMVAGTLIEEFIHLRHGLLDETRGMQNFLFDSLVSIGEQIHGEPL